MPMKTEKVVEALQKARKLIVDYWGGVNIEPAEMTESEKKCFNFELDSHTLDAHILYLCIQAEKMIVEEPHRREKVMRHLGFIQAHLWARGLVTIDHLKDMNRPDVETTS